MGGTSQYVKRLKIKLDFYTLYFGFSLPFTFFDMMRRVILCHVIADTKARTSDFGKWGQKDV